MQRTSVRSGFDCLEPAKTLAGVQTRLFRAWRARPIWHNTISRNGHTGPTPRDAAAAGPFARGPRERGAAGPARRCPLRAASKCNDARAAPLAQARGRSDAARARAAPRAAPRAAAKRLGSAPRAGAAGRIVQLLRAGGRRCGACGADGAGRRCAALRIAAAADASADAPPPPPPRQGVRREPPCRFRPRRACPRRGGAWRCGTRSRRACWTTACR